MSATGRKKKTGETTERREADFYPTPAWCVTRLLQHVELPGAHWLEPCVGDGAIVRAVNAFRPDDVGWKCIDIRSEVAAGVRQSLGGSARTMGFEANDFLSMDEAGLYQVCLTNPPFALAAPFILRGLEWAHQVVMLLRLNFLGSSNDRRHLFEQAGMPDVYVLPERPSFTGEGTDACEYAWMRWIRGKRQKSEVRILFEKSQLPMFGETP